MEPQAHEALLYHDSDEYVEGVSRYLEAGAEAGEPRLVAVPGANARALGPALDGGVELIDMEALGRNPARIIPAVREWVDAQGGRRCRFVGEPIWPGRSDSEALEATRHEALINLAFADAPVAILCPYDASRLDRRVLEDAERTHPAIHCDGGRRRSGNFTDPLTMYEAAEAPLPAPEGPVAMLAISDDLAGLRRFIEAHAARAEMSSARTADLVLAANEAATNALVHASRPGQLRIWQDDGELICELSDGGRLDDPLAGRRLPGESASSSRGLWLINQVCDLVELRAEPSSTTVRLHMRRDGG